MSGGLIALRAEILAALRADGALMGLVQTVEDGGAGRAVSPSVLLGQLVGTEWGARNLKGLSVRVPLTLVDRGDRADRLSAAAARVEAVMDDLPDEADGWRVGAVRLDRSRTVRGADGQWSMLVDYLVRLSRLL